VDSYWLSHPAGAPRHWNLETAPQFIFELLRSFCISLFIDDNWYFFVFWHVKRVQLLTQWSVHSSWRG